MDPPTIDQHAEFKIDVFQKFLKTYFVGRCFLYRTTTTSTMDVAQTEAEKGGRQGTLILTEYQTNSQARVEGRTWVAGAYQNLLFTIILKEDVFMKLVFVAGIAVTTALRKEGVDAWIKWPNDVMVGGRKICGILCKNDNGVQLVGIGININQKFKLDGPLKATSLSSILEKECSREVVLANVCNIFEKLITKDMEQILKEFQTVERLTGKTILVAPKGIENPTRTSVKVVGYSKDGYIIVEENGVNKHLSSEEVTISADGISDFDKNILLEKKDLIQLITGAWINELGSKADFIATITETNDTILTGTYHTGVGSATKSEPIHGTWSAAGLGQEGALMGWSVAWKNNNPGSPLSNASWSGRLRIINGKPIIKAFWHLTAGTDIADEWDSVTTNVDTFTKMTRKN